LFINSSGQVGVGATESSSTFGVHGTNAGGYVVSRINNTSATGFARLLFDINGGTNGTADISYVPGTFFAVGPSSNDTTTPIVFRNNNASERLRITSAGLVGVGTSSPGYKFEVDNTGGSTATARLIGNDQANVRLRIQNTGTSGRAYEIVGGLNGANNSHLSIYDATAAATRLTITETGLVGIGD
jgi:trimeric autotransporter adhesin